MGNQGSQGVESLQFYNGSRTLETGGDDGEEDFQSRLMMNVGERRQNTLRFPSGHLHTAESGTGND